MGNLEKVIEELIDESKIIVNGKAMYRGEIIRKINNLGVYLTFTNEGVSIN